MRQIAEFIGVNGTYVVTCSIGPDGKGIGPFVVRDSDGAEVEAHSVGDGTLSAEQLARVRCAEIAGFTPG